MYWQNNQGNMPLSGQQGRGSGEGSPFNASDSGGGTPFRSPLHRPRYQSSPRYHPQFGSPFPVGPGGVRPQRSPRHSPRHEYNYPLQGATMDSPYHGNNRRMSTPDNGRGRGRHYHSSNRDFSSPGSAYSDHNPGSSDDISQYYSPDMVQDPWANLQPVPHINKT